MSKNMSQARPVKSRLVKQMKKFIICILIFPICSFGEELRSGTDTILNDGVNKVRPDYENKCSNTEKDKREELHNKCKTKFGELGISEVIDDHEVIEKYSCPAVESALREMTIGCAKYAVSLPADIAKLLGSALGIGRYNKEILETCGKKPKTNFQTSRGPRSKKELKKRRKYYSVYEKYSNCSDKVVVQEKEKAKRSKAHYKKSMSRLSSNCTSRIHPRAPRAVERRNLCMLNSMKDLGVDCPRCIEELSPSQAGGSGLFKTIAAQLKQFNPAAWNCYTHEKRGALVCAAISTATGAGGAALGAAKVARALGKAAAKNATAKAKKIIARNKKESTEFKATNEKAESSLGRSITDLEKDAVFKAHKVGQGQVGKDGSPAGIGNYTKTQLREKNRILKEAGFNKEQRRKLVENGVVGNKTIASRLTDTLSAQVVKRELITNVSNLSHSDKKKLREFLLRSKDPKSGEYNISEFDLKNGISRGAISVNQKGLSATSASRVLDEVIQRIPALGKISSIKRKKIIENWRMCK